MLPCFIMKASSQGIHRSSPHHGKQVSRFCLDHSRARNRREIQKQLKQTCRTKHRKEKRLKHKVSGYKSQSKRPSIAGCRLLLRTLHLYRLRYPREPSSRVTLAEVTFSLFLCTINQPIYMYIRIVNPSRGARQLGWASCLTLAGRITLVGGRTFLHINALACLTRTTLGVVSVT